VGEIISHPSIDGVWLDNCFGEGINGYDILRSILSSGKSFKSIGAGRNNIQTGGGTAISDYLATNPPLTELYLRNNHLNDEDAVLIARALKHNSTLQILGLEENNITNFGRSALSKALYDTTSLNLMSDCNHTCEISDLSSLGGINLGDDIPCNQDYSCTARENRRCKLYHLLSLRNREESNVRHLNSEFGGEDEDEVTLKLVPRVLESVHLYSNGTMNGYRPSNTVQPLSIMYEILRGWKMPELYGQR